MGLVVFKIKAECCLFKIVYVDISPHIWGKIKPANGHIPLIKFLEWQNTIFTKLGVNIYFKIFVMKVKGFILDLKQSLYT